MSIEFFKLPESDKRKIWAALLAVLHPGQFCRLPEGSDSPPNGIERQV